MQLGEFLEEFCNESVEECIKRNVQEDLGLMLNSLQLFGVYSGLELYTNPEDGEVSITSLQ